MKKCLKCMTVHKDDMVFCPNCGDVLVEEVNPALTENPLNDTSPFAANVPPVNNMNNYPVAAPAKKQSANKLLFVLLGIFGAIIVVAAAIIVLLVFDGSKNGESAQASAETEIVTEAAEKTQPVPPTQSATHPATKKAELPAIRLTAYHTFNDFYVSYLDSINFYDSSHLGYCSETVRYEMIERFQYNRKSMFDLLWIDFDENTYSSYVSGGITYHSFYVKCCSEYYDRGTYSYKGYNYAVWSVVVAQQGDYCYVSQLDRNDEFVMSADVHTINDMTDINYLFYY